MCFPRISTLASKTSCSPVFLQNWRLARIHLARRSRVKKDSLRMGTKGKIFEASPSSMIGITASGHLCTHLSRYAKRTWGHGGAPHAQNADSKKAVKKKSSSSIVLFLMICWF